MCFNPNHDLLLNLTKYMLCLNLTKHFTTLNMWQQKSINYSKYLTFVTFTPFIHWWHAGRDLLIGSNEVLCIQSVPQYFVANDRPMEQPSGAIWNSVSKERPSDRRQLALPSEPASPFVLSFMHEDVLNNAKEIQVLPPAVEFPPWGVCCCVIVTCASVFIPFAGFRFGRAGVKWRQLAFEGCLYWYYLVFCLAFLAKSSYQYFI